MSLQSWTEMSLHGIDDSLAYHHLIHTLLMLSLPPLGDKAGLLRGRMPLMKFLHLPDSSNNAFFTIRGMASLLVSITKPRFYSTGFLPVLPCLLFHFCSLLHWSETFSFNSESLFLNTSTSVSIPLLKKLF